MKTLYFLLGVTLIVATSTSFAAGRHQKGSNPERTVEQSEEKRICCDSKKDCKGKHVCVKSPKYGCKAGFCSNDSDGVDKPDSGRVCCAAEEDCTKKGEYCDFGSNYGCRFGHCSEGM